MLTKDKGSVYLEYCEDGSREGIKIGGWCFILEIESRGARNKNKSSKGQETPVQHCNTL